MTKYVAEILKQLGIDYKQYDIRNHCDEESGETWVTLHPIHTNLDESKESSLGEKITALRESVVGRYTIRWGEDNCYLKISGILEINSDGQQVFPTPMVDKPAMFSKDYILELWMNNQESVPELICNEDCEPDDEEPTIDANVRERYLQPSINTTNEETKVAITIDEDEEEDLSLKSKRFGDKRKKT